MGHSEPMLKEALRTNLFLQAGELPPNVGAVATVEGEEVFPEPEKTLGQRYAEVWQQYCAAVDAYMAQLSAISALERSFDPCEDYSLAVQTLPLYKIKDIKKKVAENIRSRMVWHAQKLFAPEGVRMEIDTREVHSLFPIQFENGDRYGNIDERWRIEFDPVALWNHLEQTYGGDAGKELAWRQAAAIIISAFDMKHEKEIVIVAGRTVLTKRVYTRAGFRGGREIGSCDDELNKLFNALKAFAEWAGLEEFGWGARRQMGVWTYSTSVSSRETINLGNGCDYVTFYSEFKFRFSKEVTEHLQLFVGQFGTPAEED